MEKMDINRENYEAWLLDLLEGRLSPEQVQGVRDFLLLNPDCAFGLEELDPWVLEADKISYAGKPDLRKEIPDRDTRISEKNFALFSIARMEGDLSDQQERDYLDLLHSDENKRDEWLSWKQMKLVAEDLAYEGKEALKRRATRKPGVIWLGIAAAAAVLVLFFALFRFDQEIMAPGDMLSLEAEHDLESGNMSELEEIDQEQDLVLEEPLGSSPLLADEPVTLSIRKHQDPPELTGLKSDTISTKVKQEDLRARPLHLSMMDEDLMRKADKGTYDRIKPFEIQALQAYSESSAQDRFSEKGLRRAYRDFIEERDISLLSIASAGIEGINNLAGSDLKLNVSRDEHGEVTGFRFKSSLLSVDSPVKRKNSSDSMQPSRR